MPTIIPVTVGDRIVHVPSLSNRQKLFWNMTQYRTELARQAGDFAGSMWVQVAADGVYYLGPERDLHTIVDETLVSTQKYVASIADCDDFARKLISRILAKMLVSGFLDECYRQVGDKRIIRPPWCVGEAATSGHAFCHAFVDDGGQGKLVFIEPQTGRFFKPKDFPWDSGLVETRV